MATERREWLTETFSVAVSSEYTFGADALLLARFAQPLVKGRVCDLGTGCGILPFVWCSGGVDTQIDAVEWQSEATRLAQRTIAANELTNVTLYTGDWRQTGKALPAGAYVLVTCNPPYFPAGSGKANESEAARLSRHEYSATLLSDIAGIAARLLRQGGSFCLCHRPERLTDVLLALRAAGLEPKRLQWVQQRTDAAPWLFLIDAKKGGRPGLSVLPPHLMEVSA